jgi:hypothetical protein
MVSGLLDSEHSEALFSNDVVVEQMSCLDATRNSQQSSDQHREAGPFYPVTSFLRSPTFSDQRSGMMDLGRKPTYLNFQRSSAVTQDAQLDRQPCCE